MQWSVAALFALVLVLEGSAPLPRSFQKKLSHADPQIRQQAVAALVCRRNPHEFSALRGALLDRHLFVRWRGVLGLSDCKRDRALDALEGVLRDRSHLIRIAAVVGIARFSGKRSYRLLRRLLKDRHPSVRVYAIVGLVNRGYSLSFSLLRQVFRGTMPTGEQEQLTALAAIENMRVWRALPVLGWALRRSSPVVRRRAIATVVKLGRGNRRLKYKGRKMLGRFRRRGSASLRVIALVGRALLGEREATFALSEILVGRSERKAMMVLGALEEIGDVEVGVWLRLASKSTSPKIKMRALRGLRRLRARSAMGLR